MGTLKAVGGMALIIFAIYAGFQIIPPEMTNYSFQDDLRNVSIMGGADPRVTDQQLTEAVLKKAQEHQIALTPQQVTVQRMNTPGMLAVYLSADYNVPVNFPGYSFNLHFTPSSGNRGF